MLSYIFGSRTSTSALIALALLWAIGCGDTEREEDESFVSYVPPSPEGPPATGGALGLPSRTPPTLEPVAAEMPPRVHADGNDVQAISYFSGLNLLDTTQPESLVGSYSTNSKPIGLYADPAQTLVLFEDTPVVVNEISGSTFNVRQTRSITIQALDVSDPQHVVALAQETIAGEILGSRRAGDLLQVVTRTNETCSNCDDESFHVFSLNVAPGRVELLDQLHITDPFAFWNDTSRVTFSSERLYVSTLRALSEDGTPTEDQREGRIWAVDVSDPGGALDGPTAIDVAGPVTSSSRMDEHDGVLRVLSQRGNHGRRGAPTLETFRVGATEIEQLASLEFAPAKDGLLARTVFDGDRAFASFSETRSETESEISTFSFDLADPEAPVSLGGFGEDGNVLELHSAGDRLVTLAFESETKKLFIQLFDTHVAGAPVALDKVLLGEGASSLDVHSSETQKTLQLEPSSNLILVPFFSLDDGTCPWTQHGGTLLLQWDDDSLTLRGTAEQSGPSRGSLVHGDRLITASDREVFVFDIADPATPIAKSAVPISRQVDQVLAVGDELLRLGVENEIDIAPPQRVAEPQTFSPIELEPDPALCSFSSGWQAQTWTRGDFSHVVRRQGSSVRIDVIDRTDPSSPQLGSHLIFEVDGTIASITRTDEALVIGHGRGYYRSDAWDDVDDAQRGDITMTFTVVSLEEAGTPRLAGKLTVPESVARGGFGTIQPWAGTHSGAERGTMLSTGDWIVGQHEESLGRGDGRVQFHLDRLDVSDPDHPELLEPVRVPGAVSHFDGQRIVTTALQKDTASNADDGCLAGWSFDVDGACTRLFQKVHTLRLARDQTELIDSRRVNSDRWTGSPWFTSSRVFMQPRWGEIDIWEQSEDGTLRTLPSPRIGDGWLRAAAGERAFLQGTELEVIDTSRSESPSVQSFSTDGSCLLTVVGDAAYCARGDFGVRSFDLTPP